jgi:tol-pal system protein YbgF
MNGVRVSLVFILISCLTPWAAFAEAPIISAEDNTRLFDEELPLAKDNLYKEEDHPADKTITHPRQADNVDLLDKIQGLQQEIQELRGQLEVAHHDIQALKEQQLAFYKDLDNRIAPANKVAINQDISPTTPIATQLLALDTPHKNSTEEQVSYLAAFDLIQKKKYPQALAAMQTFTTNYPRGGYTANAHYWLGELYLVQKDYTKALERFMLVTKQYPTSNKSAASALKIGYALAAMGQIDAAKKQLQQVMKQYPDSSTAHQAQKKLSTLV